MKKLLISATVGASALLGSSAQAADLTSSEFYAEEAPVVQRVRTVCDDFGRCWREPSRRTVIIERDDDYAPRERYIERYRYAPRERYIERRYHHDRPAAGVGIRAPGVSVGVGLDDDDDDRW
jgi:hypothetical protein